MTNSQATANVYFSNSTSQVYTLDAIDGTEGALLELVSGSEVGTAAQGLSIVGISVSKIKSRRFGVFTISLLI